MNTQLRPPVPALLVFFATLAFVCSPLLAPGFEGFRTDQFPVPQITPPVQPAGYAFAIWGVIYLWLLVSAGFGLLRRASAPDWEPMRLSLAASVGMGAVWLPLAQVSPLAATVLIWLMLGTALMAVKAAPPLDPWMARAPVEIYAGWLTAASSVSIGLVLAGYGLTNQNTAAVVGLLLALVIALVVLRRLPGTGPFGLAVVWALVAVVVNNLTRGNPWIAALAGLAALVLLVMSLSRGPLAIKV